MDALVEAKGLHQEEITASSGSNDGRNPTLDLSNSSLSRLAKLQAHNLFQKLFDASLLLPMRMKHNSRHFQWDECEEDWEDRL